MNSRQVHCAVGGTQCGNFKLFVSLGHIYYLLNLLPIFFFNFSGKTETIFFTILIWSEDLSEAPSFHHTSPRASQKTSSAGRWDTGFIFYATHPHALHFGQLNFFGEPWRLLPIGNFCKLITRRWKFFLRCLLCAFTVQISCFCWKFNVLLGKLLCRKNILHR